MPLVLAVCCATGAVLFLAPLVAHLLAGHLHGSGSGGGSSPPPGVGGRPEGAPPFEYALPLNPFDLSEGELAAALDLAADAGATTITTGAAWWYVEPERGAPKRWEPLDRLLEEAERRGLKVRVQVSGTPDWAHPDLWRTVPEFEKRIWHPPANEEERALFGAFLAEMAGRYGTRISGYEVWNEPNYDAFWAPAPDAAAYAEVLRGAHGAIKGAAPDARVVFGGISMNDAEFLEAFYEAARRRHPDAAEKGYFFDELNVHPYTYGQSPETAASGSSDGGSAAARVDERDGGPAGLGSMKEAMERNADPGKTVFAGEFGYSTSETFMPAVPDATRALHLLSAYRAARSMPFVSGLSWYGFVPSDTTGPEWTLLDGSLRPNETYEAYRRVAREDPRAPRTGAADDPGPEAPAFGWAPARGAPAPGP